MGAFGKLVGFSVIFILTYFCFALIVAAIYSLGFALGLGAGQSPLTMDAVAIATIVLVLTLFTIPAVLGMFGHAGPWFRHIVLRSAKWLGGAFAVAVLFNWGAAGLLTAESDWAPTMGAETVALGMAFTFVALGFLSPNTMLKVAEAAAGVALRLPAAFIKGRENTVAVELRVAPTKRLREKDQEVIVRNEALRFRRFVQSLAALGLTVEFRLRFREKRGKALLLARGRKSSSELERRLLSVTKAHLFDTSPVLHHWKDEALAFPSTVRVKGAPEFTLDPLEPLARFFLENGYEGDYSVVIRRHIRNPISKLIARREQRRLSEVSSKQKSSTSLAGDQTTTTTQDHWSQIELEEAAKEVERCSTGLAVEAWVFITAFGSTGGESAGTAESAAEVIRSSLSSHREKRELKLQHCRRPIAPLFPKGRPSVLLSDEAASLVWVPQMAMGTEVAPSAEFELPPPLEGEVELGEVVTRSGRSGHKAKVKLDDLTRHAFISGRTGSGKTTSCFNVLLQLHDLGVPFLVIEPVKTEYRSLASAVRGLQVFTLGDEDTAPFRLNIFEPPAGVKVQTHLENLEAAWKASFVMYSPVPYMIKPILFETYQACGWDVKGNRRGRPITLADFLVHAERWARNSGYEPKVLMDIEGQLRSRISSLTYGSKGDLFNAISSTPLESILRRPTVLELKGIASSEEKAFVASLILSNIAEHLESRGASKRLGHFTLIEEAHRLLPNISTEKGDPEGADARRGMVERFADMLAEVRAYGEGLAIVEQIPTKILPDAIKNSATKVVHQVPAADDTWVIAGATGMTAEQAQVLTALKPGEAVVHVPGHPLPLRVEVPNRLAKLGMGIGEMPDDEVKDLMAEYYLKNPLPRTPSKAREESLRTLIDTEWFRARFLTNYREAIRVGRPDLLLGLVTETARKVSRDEGEFAANLKEVLRLGTEFYLPFDEEDKARFPREVMRYMERSDGIGKRG